MGMKENLGIFKNKNNGKSLLGREILFRGKRIDGDGWVYGNYSEAIFYTTNEREYQIETKDDGYNHYGVFPETVGQFTGLVDKNGDKIFEGDILKVTYPEEEPCYYSVVWRNSGFRADCDDEIVIDALYVSNDEIIGNIYDNPDNCSAECDYQDLKIRLVPYTCENKKQSDFIHEVVHAIADNLGYKEQDEQAVEAFAQALYAVIIDNPEMFKE